MFGYINVNREKLSLPDRCTYQSYYCGLCQKLKDECGRKGQMLLNYDMTFLVVLLTGLYELDHKELEFTCPLHPTKKQRAWINEATEYAADMNALFACYKCRDDWKDEKKLHQLLYGRVLEGRSRRLQETYGEKLRRIERLMQDFEETEQQEPQTGPGAQDSGYSRLDTLAGLFGKVMAEIVTVREDEWADHLRRFGFFLGKFIYLMDAYEDVETDIRNGTPNPLKGRYGSPDFEEACRTMLTMMMSECCSAFEILPILDNVEILRNVLYSGVWCRYTQVTNQRSGQD